MQRRIITQRHGTMFKHTSLFLNYTLLPKGHFALRLISSDICSNKNVTNQYSVQNRYKIDFQLFCYLLVSYWLRASTFMHITLIVWGNNTPQIWFNLVTRSDCQPIERYMINDVHGREQKSRGFQWVSILFGGVYSRNHRILMGSSSGCVCVHYHKSMRFRGNNETLHDTTFTLHLKAITSCNSRPFRQV